MDDDISLWVIIADADDHRNGKNNHNNENYDEIFWVNTFLSKYTCWYLRLLTFKCQLLLLLTTSCDLGEYRLEHLASEGEGGLGHSSV